MLLKINEFLPYQLVSLANNVSGSFSKVYQEHAQLTTPQWRVIAHLASINCATAKQLCDLASIDKSTISRAIKQLQERGLIDTQPDKHDKRATLLILTERGLNLYKELSPKAQVWEQNFLEKFTEEEKNTLKQLLNKLAE